MGVKARNTSRALVCVLATLHMVVQLPTKAASQERHGVLAFVREGEARGIWIVEPTRPRGNESGSRACSGQAFPRLRTRPRTAPRGARLPRHLVALTELGRRVAVQLEDPRLRATGSRG
jgi:hypothetical protein